MPPTDTAEAADKCPVDHQTREKWLEAAKARGQAQAQAQAQAPVPHPHPPPQTIPTPTARELRRAEIDRTKNDNMKPMERLQPQILRMTTEQRKQLLLEYDALRDLEEAHALGRTKFSLDRLRWLPATDEQLSSPQTQRPRKVAPLAKDREVSSIPRALPTNHDRQHLNSAEAAAMPSNSERDTGHDRESGNWIYPSQEMFFSAMKRKGHEAQAADMATVVPIHNAVNEKAWSEIRAWEAGRGAEKCGGPKLISFSGDSKALTPRARWKALVGYQTPFDRHDWVVDRCGKRVEYVIDFYSGKEDGGAMGKNLNFHLDVRPKLNSWDGIATRVARAWGM